MALADARVAARLDPNQRGLQPQAEAPCQRYLCCRGNPFQQGSQRQAELPGWKQILIKPFDLLCDLRFYLCTHRGFEWALKGTALELWLIAKLLSWASQRSVGVKVNRETDRARAIEGYSKTLAGH